MNPHLSEGMVISEEIYLCLLSLSSSSHHYNAHSVLISLQYLFNLFIIITSSSFLLFIRSRQVISCLFPLFTLLFHCTFNLYHPSESSFLSLKAVHWPSVNGWVMKFVPWSIPLRNIPFLLPSPLFISIDPSPSTSIVLAWVSSSSSNLFFPLCFLYTVDDLIQCWIEYSMPFLYYYLLAKEEEFFSYSSLMS